MPGITTRATTCRFRATPARIRAGGSGEDSLQKQEKSQPEDNRRLHLPQFHVSQLVGMPGPIITQVTTLHGMRKHLFDRHQYNSSP
jgi:hypothetical protein